LNFGRRLLALSSSIPARAGFVCAYIYSFPAALALAKVVEREEKKRRS